MGARRSGLHLQGMPYYYPEKNNPRVKQKNGVGDHDGWMRSIQDPCFCGRFAKELESGAGETHDYVWFSVFHAG